MPETDLASIAALITGLIIHSEIILIIFVCISETFGWDLYFE